MFVTKEKDGRNRSRNLSTFHFPLDVWCGVAKIPSDSFFQSLSLIPSTTQGTHLHGYTMLVLTKHRLGSVEMNTWEYHSLPVDVLVDYNGHIRLCRCGLTLRCSQVHRRLWSGSTSILPFPRRQIQCSSFLQTSWFPHRCQAGVMLMNYNWNDWTCRVWSLEVYHQL